MQDADLLQTLHPHPRDMHLSLVSGTNTYYIDGVASAGSVTGLIHQFTHEFDPDNVIQAMQKGARWPRPGYLKPACPTQVFDTLAAVPNGEKLLQAFCLVPRDEELICRIAAALRAQHPLLRDALCSIALSPVEIERKWELNAVDASNRGAWMHLTFEHYLNRNIVDTSTAEMHLLLKYLGTLSNLRSHRTEWTIYGTDERLAGSIDFVAMNTKGEYVLFDWKRSKNLRHKYTNHFRSMKGPLSFVPDCSGWHYRLQLNCYKYLLEQYY